MRKRTKKLMSILLTFAMGAALLTGCGSSQTAAEETPAEESASSVAVESTAAAEGTESGETESAAPDISEEVELTMYCIGDEGGMYADDALDNLNAILKEKINATIKPVMVSWGEYREKLPLIYASGEAYDLAYVANWCNYSEEAIKGPFLELTDLMQQYAPKTYAELEASGALEAAKVNGSLYMVPSSSAEYTETLVMWREDLRKQFNLPEITDWETLETYMDGILENVPGMFPMALTNTTLLEYTFYGDVDWARPIVGGNGFGVLTYKVDDGSEIFNVVETPEYEEFVKRNREWYEKGYWSRNVLSETTAIEDSFMAERSAIVLGNSSKMIEMYKKVQQSNPEWELGFANLSGGVIEKTAPTNNGMAIGINSKNPERAMMFLELMNQDEEAFRAMYYGIEGTTYVVTEDGRKANPEGVDPSTLNLRNLGMGMQVQKFILDDADAEQSVLDLVDSYEDIAVYPALSAFVIDDTNIAAEIAAINNVVTEYKIPLDLGVADPETALPELKQKLADAGLDKVMEEVSRQVAEFNAAQAE